MDKCEPEGSKCYTEKLVINVINHLTKLLIIELADK